jgi:hypothetical protein
MSEPSTLENRNLELIEYDSEEVPYTRDEQTWREKHPPVKPEVLKGRRYASDFAGALRAVLHGVGFADSVQDGARDC